jgi:environmental stress-induced protein Ves
MQTLRSSDYRRMPWKNGAGETIEIAVSPASAGFDDLDWRISMAAVSSDGAFSVFPGLDRTLCILRGDGLGLEVDGAPEVELTSASPPFAFPADVPVHARLLGEPVADLNVMTRRGTHAHGVQRLDVRTAQRVTTEADVVVIFCHSGHLLLESSNGQATLAPLDCAIDRTPPTAWSLVALSPAVVFVVQITGIGARAR